MDVSDGDDEEEAAVSIAAAADKYKPASLDKMITLIASLVEKSRDSAGKLQLSEKDYNAVAGGKGFAFLHQQIRDNINLQQTRNLIHSLCKSSGGNALAQSIICMVSQAIARHSEACQPFFKMLTLLTEGGSTGAASGSTSQPPCFTQLVLQKVWEAAECCPYSALDWLALQVHVPLIIDYYSTVVTVGRWVSGDEKQIGSSVGSVVGRFVVGALSDRPQQSAGTNGRRLSAGLARSVVRLSAGIPRHSSHATRTAARRGRSVGFAPGVRRPFAVAGARQTLHGDRSARHHQTDHLLCIVNVLLRVEGGEVDGEQQQQQQQRTLDISSRRDVLTLCVIFSLANTSFNCGTCSIRS